MSKAPKRPAGVPAKAWWDPNDSEWVFGPLVDDKKHGDFTFWRADGTKCNECHLVMDVPQGPFKRFHESGEVSQEGQYEQGQLHGTRRWFSTDAKTTENTRAPGVSEAVWRSEMDYVQGRVVAIRHFDREGRRVAPTTGEPYPARPESVDERAEYVETQEQWHRGDADGEDQQKVGRWRLWTRDGQLLQDVNYVDGELEGKGTLYVRGGSPFADARIALERGEFKAGLRAGRWELCDAKEHVIAVSDYGDTSSLEQAQLPAFSNDVTADFAALARKLEGEGKVVEALATWARAAGRTRDTQGFEALRAKVARPVKEEVAHTLANEADREASWLAYELVEGAEPATLLNKLGIALDQAGQSRAALDFTNAAILLAPDRSDFLFTRALILMSLGLKAQAEHDANELAAEEPDRAEFLLLYLNAIFPSYVFTPAGEAPTTTYEDVPDAPSRSLEALQLLAQQYATRLHLVRERLLLKLTPENPALPPELSKLLPEGPLELEHVPELEADVPSLLRVARADWGALAWLCWATGLSEVALPRELSPPADFGKAAGMAQQRLWRARDQRVFNGRNAQAHGAASFEWEGADIAEIPPPIAGIAEQQYAELQALFYWLVDENLESPWDDGLRGS